jgi:uncharacterized protein (TIGR02246 family)
MRLSATKTKRNWRKSMPAKKPEDCDLLVAEYINSGNVDAAVALYEPNATFMAEPGKPVTGHAAIRQLMAGMMATKPKLTMKVPIVVQNGELALLVSDYTVVSTGPDGKQTSISARGTEVVRRQADGNWLFVIDNPTGTA